MLKHIIILFSTTNACTQPCRCLKHGVVLVLSVLTPRRSSMYLLNSVHVLYVRKSSTLIAPLYDVLRLQLSAAPNVCRASW